MKKEQDLFYNAMANQDATLLDFFDAGMTADNTQLLPKQQYMANPKVSQMPLFLSAGVFDLKKFDALYDNILKMYSQMALNSQSKVDAQAYAGLFDEKDIFAPKALRGKRPTGVQIKLFYNPDRQLMGIERVGQMSAPTKSMEEIALGLKVLANPKAVANGADPIWHDAPEDSWFTDFFDTRVLAQWDYDADKNGNPTKDPSKIVYHKGAPKLNDNGTYYYENLDGRDIYGRRVLNKMNTLTKEGTWLNQYDFFDSDDLGEKSAVGTIAKNAVLVGSMFLPYVGPWIAGLSVLNQSVGLMGTLGKVAMGAIGNTGSDNEILSYMEGWGAQTGREARSEYALQNPWCLENMINMIGDVAGLLKEQRFLFEYAPALIKGTKVLGAKNGISLEKAEKWQKELEASYKKVFNTKMKDLLNIAPEEYAKARVIESQLGRLALNDVDKFIKSYNKAGEVLSKAYMTAITVGDTYGEAKQAGASDREAALLTLGYAGGEAWILNQGIGEWILPELKGEGLHRKRIVEALEKIGIEGEEGALGATRNINTAWKRMANEGRRDYAKRVIKAGRDAFFQNKKDWEGITKHTIGGIASSALGEGTEEVSEEFLADFSKTCFNLYKDLSGDKDPNHKMTAWDNMLDRYALNFVGGFIGGGLTSAGTTFKMRNQGPMTSQEALQLLVYMGREGLLPKFLKEVDKMTVANKYLSTKVSKDGNGDYNPEQGTDDNNLDLALHKMIHNTVQNIQNILDANGINLSDESFLTRVLGVEDSNRLIKEMKYAMISNSSQAGRYLQEWNTTCTNIVKLTDEINNIGKSSQETDKEKRINKTEGNPSGLTQELELRKSQLESLLKDLLKYKDELLEGKYTMDFAASSLFEMSPMVISHFAKPTLKQFAEYKSGKKWEDLTDQKKEEFANQYTAWKETDFKNDIAKIADIFHNSSHAFAPIIQQFTEAYDKMRLSKSLSDMLKQQSESESLLTMNAGNDALLALATGIYGDLLGQDTGRLLAEYGGDEYKQGLERFVSEDPTKRDSRFRWEQQDQELTSAIIDNLDSIVGEVENYGDNVSELKKDIKSKLAAIKAKQLTAEYTAQQLQLEMVDLFKENSRTINTAEMRNINKNYATQLQYREELTAFHEMSLIKNLSKIIDEVTKAGVINPIIKSSLISIVKSAEVALHNNLFGYQNNNGVAVNYKAGTLTGFLRFFDAFTNIESEEDYKNKLIDVINDWLISGSSFKFDVIGEIEGVVPEVNDMEVTDLTSEQVQQINQILNTKLLEIYDSIPLEIKPTLGDNLLENIVIAESVGKRAIAHMAEYENTINNATFSPIMNYLLEYLNQNSDKQIDVKDLFNVAQLLLDLNLRDLSQLTMLPNIVSNMQEVSAAIDMLIGLTQAAKNETDTLGNIFGYNKILNEIGKGREGWEELAEINDTTANIILQDLNLLKGRLDTALAINDFNTGNKLNLQHKVALNKDYIFYNRLKDFVVTIPDIWKDKDKLEKALEDAKTLTKYYQDKNLEITKEERNAITKEMVIIGDALFDFGQANSDLIADPTKLATLILNPSGDLSINIFENTTNLLNENTKTIEDPAFLSWLTSRFSIRASSFYKAFTPTISGERAPISTQEEAVFLNVSKVINGQVGANMVEAIQFATKLYWDGGHQDFLKSKYKLPNSVGVEAVMASMPNYKNIVLTEGVPGSGKSFAVYYYTMQTLGKIDSGRFLKNVWITHVSDKSAGILRDSMGIPLDHSQVFEHQLMLKQMCSWYDLNVTKDPETGKYTFTNGNGLSDVCKFGNNGQLTLDWSKIQVNKDTNAPSLIVIDEMTHYTDLELLIIQKYAEVNGIQILAAGDYDQSCAKSDEFSIGSIDFGLNPNKFNFLRVPKLGVSMRINNSQLNKNLTEMLVRMQKGKGTFTVFNFEDLNGIYGFKKTTDTTVKEDVAKIISTLKEGEKVGFIFNDTNTELYKELSKPEYTDKVTKYPGNAAQGMEGQYFIVDVTGADLLFIYTGISRAEQGGLLYGYNSDIEFHTDAYTQQESFSKEGVKNFSAERREVLLGVYNDNTPNLTYVAPVVSTTNNPPVVLKYNEGQTVYDPQGRPHVIKEAKNGKYLLEGATVAVPKDLFEATYTDVAPTNNSPAGNNTPPPSNPPVNTPPVNIPPPNNPPTPMQPKFAVGDLLGYDNSDWKVIEVNNNKYQLLNIYDPTKILSDLDINTVDTNFITYYLKKYKVGDIVSNATDKYRIVEVQSSTYTLDDGGGNVFEAYFGVIDNSFDIWVPNTPTATSSGEEVSSEEVLGDNEELLKKKKPAKLVGTKAGRFLNKPVLSSAMTFESGCDTIEHNDEIFYITTETNTTNPARIDSVNGLAALFGDNNFYDVSRGSDIPKFEYDNIIGRIKLIIANTPNLGDLLEKLINYLSLTQARLKSQYNLTEDGFDISDIKCKFGLVVNHGGLNSFRKEGSEFRVFDKNLDTEKQLYNEGGSNVGGVSSDAVNKRNIGLVVSLGNSTQPMLFIPVIALPSVFTEISGYDEYADIYNQFKVEIDNLAENTKEAPILALKIIDYIRGTYTNNYQDGLSPEELYKYSGLVNELLFFIRGEENNYFDCPEGWTPAQQYVRGTQYASFNTGHGGESMAQDIDAAKELARPDIIKSSVYITDQANPINQVWYANKGHLFTLTTSNTDLLVEDANGNIDLEATDEKMLEQWMRQCNGERIPAGKKVNIIYLKAPKADVSEYLRTLIEMTKGNRQEMPLGRTITAYRIWEKLLETNIDTNNATVLQAQSIVKGVRDKVLELRTAYDSDTSNTNWDSLTEAQQKKLQSDWTIQALNAGTSTLGYGGYQGGMQRYKRLEYKLVDFLTENGNIKQAELDLILQSASDLDVYYFPTKSKDATLGYFKKVDAENYQIKIQKWNGTSFVNDTASLTTTLKIDPTDYQITNGFNELIESWVGKLQQRAGATNLFGYYSIDNDSFMENPDLRLKGKMLSVFNPKNPNSQKKKKKETKKVVDPIELQLTPAQLQLLDAIRKYENEKDSIDDSYKRIMLEDIINLAINTNNPQVINSAIADANKLHNTVAFVLNGKAIILNSNQFEGKQLLYNETTQQLLINNLPWNITADTGGATLTFAGEISDNIVPYDTKVIDNLVFTLATHPDLVENSNIIDDDFHEVLSLFDKNDPTTSSILRQTIKEMLGGDLETAKTLLNDAGEDPILQEAILALFDNEPDIQDCYNPIRIILPI